MNGIRTARESRSFFPPDTPVIFRCRPNRRRPLRSRRIGFAIRSSAVTPSGSSSKHAPRISGRRPTGWTGRRRRTPASPASFDTWEQRYFDWLDTVLIPGAPAGTVDAARTALVEALNAIADDAP